VKKIIHPKLLMDPKMILLLQIPDSFANYFAEACSPNSTARYQHSTAAFNASLQNYPPNDHSLEYSLSVEQVDSIVHKLKLGKAASLDKLTVEHIKYDRSPLYLDNHYKDI